MFSFLPSSEKTHPSPYSALHLGTPWCEGPLPLGRAPARWARRVTGRCMSGLLCVTAFLRFSIEFLDFQVRVL